MSYMEDFERRAAEKQLEKKKHEEVTFFWSYLDDYRRAVKMPSFINNVRKALEGAINYNTELILTAFEKLRTDEYMTAEEEWHIMQFIKDRKVNRHVIYNVESKVKDILYNHDMHIQYLEAILAQDEDDANNILENIGEVSNVSHSPFSWMQFREILNEEDSRKYFAELEAKHPLQWFTHQEVINLKAINAKEIIQQKKRYAAKKLKYHKDLAYCLRNILTQHTQPHFQNFDNDTSGSLFTLGRLVNLHQATHEMKSWKVENKRKSKNIKIISEREEAIRVARNNEQFDFSHTGDLERELHSSNVFLQSIHKGYDVPEMNDNTRKKKKKAVA